MSIKMKRTKKYASSIHNVFWITFKFFSVIYVTIGQSPLFYAIDIIMTNKFCIK